MQLDGVLEGSDQESVYTGCAAEAIDNVLAGYNSTLLCYGQVLPCISVLWPVWPPKTIQYNETIIMVLIME
jgi:hypothetical protein